MGRPSKKSLQFQFKETLQGMVRFGQSRHEAKEERRKAGEKNIGATDGIFSINTLIDYVKKTKHFAKWVKIEHGCRTMADAKQYVPEFLEYRKTCELSPWTIHGECAAISKAYGCSMNAWGVELPRRTKDKIKRSRYNVEMDKHINTDNYPELMDFLHGVGPRNFEAEKAKPEDVSPDEKVVHIRGKGGKHRNVTVLPMYVESIKAMVEKAKEEGRTKLFESIPKNLDVHAIRREFAQAKYKFFVEQGMIEYNGKKIQFINAAARIKEHGFIAARCFLYPKSLGITAKTLLQ